MGLGRRLLNVVRANVGYRLRRGLGIGAPGAGHPETGRPGAAGAGEAAQGAAGSYENERQGGAAPPPRDSRDPRRARLERHYRALELPYGADADAVRSAHRRLLRSYHPDRFARDPERLEDATRLSQELTHARDELLAALERREV